MAIYRIKKEENFVILDKGFLNDDRLSWAAKGLLAHLLGRPADWEVHISELIKRSTNGEYATRSALRELQEKRYILFIRIRLKGRFESGQYHVFSQPQSVENPRSLQPAETHHLVENREEIREAHRSKKPEVDLPDAKAPHLDFQDMENQGLINKEITKKKLNKEKAAAEECHPIPKGVELNTENASAALRSAKPLKNCSLTFETGRGISNIQGRLATLNSVSTPDEKKSAQENRIIGHVLTKAQEVKVLQLAKEMQVYLPSYTLEERFDELSYEILDDSFSQCERDFGKKLNVVRKAILNQQWQHSRKTWKESANQKAAHVSNVHVLKTQLRDVELEMNSLQHSILQYQETHADIAQQFKTELQRFQHEREQLLHQITPLQGDR